jgi:hypothetical protein
MSDLPPDAEIVAVGPDGCPCSGCTDYPPDEPRCPKCGYTQGDADVLMDHRPPYCDGKIPGRRAPERMPSDG